jgi:hypothetical protein
MAGRTLLRLALIGGVVAALTAAQTLPFLDLLKHSQRDVNYDTNAWAMPIWGWANLLVPLFHETPSQSGVYSQFEQQWTSSYYLGIAALALAIIPIGLVRNRRVWTLAGLTAFALWMALGVQGGLYAVLKSAFPQLGMIRFPVKYVVIAVFTVPVLSAYGLKAVLNGGPIVWPRITRILAAAGLLIGVILAIAWLDPKPHEELSVACISGLSRAGILAIFFGLLWLLNRKRDLDPQPSSTSEIQSHDTSPDRLPTAVGKSASFNVQFPIYNSLLPLALIVWFALDFLTHAPRQNPTVATDVFTPEAGLFESKPKAGESRACISSWMNRLMGNATHPDPRAYCLGNRRLLFCNWNLVDRIPKVNGFYSLYPREHTRVLQLIYDSTNRPPAPLLDFLGVTQITVDTNLFALEFRTNAMPLVSIGQQPVFATAKDTLRRMAGNDFNPRKEVFLPWELSGRLAMSIGAQASIKLTEFRNQALTMEFSATGPTFAVIAQTYDPKWRATVDGQPGELLRANHAFQAVAVPAGRHTLRLVYEDRSFRRGAAISLISLAGCLLAWRFLAPRLPRKSP